MLPRAASSLIDICLGDLKLQILRGDDENLIKEVYELPTELFDGLLKRLPALALHTLQLHMPDVKLDDFKLEGDFTVDGRKRIRCEKFNLAWMELFCSRWQKIFLQLDDEDLSEKCDMAKLATKYDWRQKYWEMHLQNCFDAASAIAMLPSFHKHIGEIEVPDELMKAIGYEWQILGRNYSKLYSHCQQFGLYARCLRFQNVLCTDETFNLLKNSKLEGLVLRRISSKTQVDALCRTLCQNAGTITSLELINCKLSLGSMEEICNALLSRNKDTHMLENFTVKASKLSYPAGPFSSPYRCIPLVSSGRLLKSINICDNQLEREFAKSIIKTLLESSSSSLYSLDSSKKQIPESLNPPSTIEVSTSLQSLWVLNLRGNDLTKEDMEDLRSAVIHMPMLETLDLSDNPIEDEGIRSLIPIFSKNGHPELSSLVYLKLKNCKLYLEGATELLEVLMDSNYPLQYLSLADNPLGSDVAVPLGKFLGSPHIKWLHIEDVELGPSGFQTLQKQMPEAVNLVSINISQNRGGYEAAKFLVRLLDRAPELVSVDSTYNLMPPASLEIIYSALDKARGSGRLRHIDLIGNPRLCNADYASKIVTLEHNWKPIVSLPNRPAPDAPYDDDP